MSNIDKKNSNSSRFKQILENERDSIWEDLRAGKSSMAKLAEFFFKDLFNLFYEVNDFKLFGKNNYPVFDIHSDSLKMKISIKCGETLKKDIYSAVENKIDEKNLFVYLNFKGGRKWSKCTFIGDLVTMFDHFNLNKQDSILHNTVQLEKISDSELQKPSEIPEAFEDRIESVSDFLDKTKTKTKINEFLVFGTLSIVRVEPNEVTKKEILNNWIQTEVISKIVKNGGLSESRVLLDLLKYLSNNVGNFISISRVADNLSTSKREVFNLLENLQEIYIIYRLPLIFKNGNLHRELCKYYFYDLGVRNCIISDFSTFNLRTNNWQLWENFIISERIKNLKIKALGLGRETFFWDYASYENIEWIEKVNGKLNCYQISFNVDEVSTLKYFREVFPQAEVININKENYINFIFGK